LRSTALVGEKKARRRKAGAGRRCAMILLRADEISDYSLRELQTLIIAQEAEIAGA
jgi:hypothetical protein